MTLAAIGGVISLYYAYEVVESGELVLDNAPGIVSIIREKDTKVMTIRGDSEESVAYAQGFATAQLRLWQIEKMRRLSRGTLSEILGETTLPIDEFMRHIGLTKLA